MYIYTMGFTKKDAEHFFELIKNYKIELLIDVRLNNQSQLAGFTKGRDIGYFLKEICNCKYEHNINCAPTKELLKNYKDNKISWGEYEILYKELIMKRKLADMFEDEYSEYSNILLLCSEPTPEHCHRRILAEYLNKELEYSIIHI